MGPPLRVSRPLAMREIQGFKDIHVLLMSPLKPRGEFMTFVLEDIVVCRPYMHLVPIQHPSAIKGVSICQCSMWPEHDSEK